MALEVAARPRPATAGAPMALTRVALHDYRSYATADLAPDPGLTVIVGPNGTGKTNLLEAISVAITGRSHRAATDAELVRHGAGFARVRVDIGPAGGDGQSPNDARIELVVPGAAPPEGVRKRLTLNGVPRRPGSVGEVARAVLFRPEEMLLLVGSPSDRRRFLDGIVAQRSRAAARDLGELARVLAQRNALLRAIRAEEASLDAMAFWDEQLAAVGARAMRARLQVVADLASRIGALHSAVAPAGEPADAVSLEYVDGLKESWPDRVHPGVRVPEVEELESAYRRRIDDVQPKEAWNGVSLVGPQRDDLRVSLGGREVGTHASRGQQRTIILALKLAETDLLGADGPRPVILLDDVFSELDPSRAGRLATLLADRGQVIVTTADPALGPVAGEGAVVTWSIRNGSLERAA